MLAPASALFFLSGAAALAFETLWFHQAGLALGNSVVASSLVLAGFMGGLACGNALAIRFGDAVASPLRAFARLELLVGASGVALVAGLPSVGPVLAPALAGLGEGTPALAAARFGVAFALLAIPSTAMGLTLPLLTRALVDTRAAYGPVLARLYGWNTLGAVAGVALAEGVGVARLGIQGTAWVAAGLNAVAAAGAWRLARRLHAPAPVERDPSASGGRFWGVAAFAQGFALLALEVIVFRFLSLFVVTRSEAFAAMLGVALAGIGLGGLLGEWSLRRWARAHRGAATAAFASGALLLAGYAVFPAWSSSLGSDKVSGVGAVLRLTLPLLGPVSLLSGLLFAWLGAGWRETQPTAVRTTGALTVANTLGSAVGSLAAVFVLLPGLGMERSWLALGVLYAATGALLLWRHSSRAPAGWAAVAFLASVVLFPFGAMESRHFPRALDAYDLPQDARVTTREGVNETLLWVETPFLGQPYTQRLVTNSFSMSATDVQARRYMKLYVYLPVALHPQLERALLVSYGVGSTAKALVDTPGLEQIDVVDISRDILELSDRAFPDPAEHPLRDPRVRVHVEDGRYFLETTQERYDLITGEPPPPMVAGVVNLYTREYFDLVRSRLADGGWFTTWLPLRQLTDASSLAIVRAFCDAFPDCSLWRGMSFDLMLVGSRDAEGHPDEARFRAQWEDPQVEPELQALGFERPEQLGALFIADAEQLETWIEDVLPLVDDRPKRITAPPTSIEAQHQLFAAWLDPRTARARFGRSAWVARHWPTSQRSAALSFFEIQHLLDTFGQDIRSDLWSERLTDLRAVLGRSNLRTPVLWLLGSDADVQRIVDAAGDAEPEVILQRGIRALAERDYGTAIERLEAAEAHPATFERAAALTLFTHCHVGQADVAQALALDFATRLKGGPRRDDLFAYLGESCGVQPR